jgi:hypothetical protein
VHEFDDGDPYAFVECVREFLVRRNGDIGLASGSRSREILRIAVARPTARRWRSGCVGRVSSSACTYSPKAAATSVVYRVVRDHFATFRAEALRHDDRGLPRFIDDEFRGLLRPFDVAQGGLSKGRRPVRSAGRRDRPLPL